MRVLCKNNQEKEYVEVNDTDFNKCEQVSLSGTKKSEEHVDVFIQTN